MEAERPVFDHSAIAVKNLAVSIDFYRQILRLQQLDDPFKDDLHAWFSIGNHLQLHLIMREGDASPSMNVHFCLRVKSIPEFILHLKKNKISYYDAKGIEGQVKKRADGISQIYFKDPDGYWIEINDAVYPD